MGAKGKQAARSVSRSKTPVKKAQQARSRSRTQSKAPKVRVQVKAPVKATKTAKSVIALDELLGSSQRQASASK